MSELKQYLFTIISAAIIVGVITTIFEKKSPNIRFIQMIGGLFILLTLCTPLTRKNFASFSCYFDEIEADSKDQVTMGQLAANDSMREIIKEQAEAYICDKATALGVELSVSVSVSTEEIPMPYAVKLEGSISPYAKSKITDIIANDIGISEDRQTWK